MTAPPATSLLDNPSARVSREDPHKLRCEVPGSAVTFLLVLGSGGALLMGLAALLLVATGKAPLQLLASSAMGVAFAAVLGALARGRRRRSGTFLVDGAARRIERHRRGSQDGSWSFDDVVALRDRLDLTDGMRPDLLPDLPRWLEATMRDGTRLRLAKGGRKELAAVRAALEELGLRVGE